MFDKITKLKEKEYFPDLIFDIGANHGTWTREMMNIYPDKKYILIEAIDYSEWLNDLKENSNVLIFNAILNDKIEEVDWFELKNTGDSMFKEKKGVCYKDCLPIKKNSTTLNDLIENMGNEENEENKKNKKEFLNDCKNIMIKIDCQGAEIPILKGSTNILDKVDFIILELPLFGQYNENVPNFLQHIKYMDDIGFIPYDIVDNHYINEFNMQIDMIFINKNHNFNEIVQDKMLP